VITLEQLNAMAAGEFVTTLGGIFEHSAWVPQAAEACRPFGSRLQLLDAMRAAVDQASSAQQLALIRAHPTLAVPAHRSSPLTTASAGEQRRAGLDSCTPEDGLRLEELNARYLERFGFPFVLAVRGHDPASIFANFEQRLGHAGELEHDTALRQIGAIAAYRLAEMVASPPGPEIVAMVGRLAHSLQAAGAAAGTATALLCEWMRAAGLDVSAAHGPYLMGRASATDSSATVLLAGVCRDSLTALRYHGSTAAVIAIEAARQLRQKGARPALALAVLVRPDDWRVGTSDCAPDSTATPAWVELSAADATDAEGRDIVRALQSANLGVADRMLVRRGNGGTDPIPVTDFTAVAADQAARALEASLVGAHAVA
jgi:OHCU decarboxylase